MLGALFFADAAVLVTRWWTDKPAPLVVPFFVLLLALSFALRRGAVRTAAHGTCALVVITVLGMTYLAGRLPPILHVFAVIPLFATYVLGRRGGQFWLVMCLAALGLAELGLAYLPVPLPSGRELPALSVLITLGLAFAVVYAFEAQRTSSARAISDRDADARALLAVLPDVVLRVGVSGLSQNSAPERLSNRDAEALLADEGVRGSLLAPREEDVELTVDLDGRAFAVRLVPIEGQDDVLLLVRDLTDAQRLEKRVTKAELIASLERANRMSSLGVMAACIAHEVNNPLAYLAGNLSFLGQRAERDAPIDEDHRGAIRDAIDATDRVRAIVGELKLYAREDSEEIGPVAVHRIVDEATKLVRNELKHSASVLVSGEPRWVRGVESRLVQVVLNLLLNASQAFVSDEPDGNRVWIHVGDDGERVEIRVSDNGPGIPDELLQRVSRPFFTTKEPGRGTGLGLAVCEEIVVQSRGELRIRNRAAGGAEVSVFLPRVEPPAELPVPRKERAPRRERRRGRILIIDDEPLVRRALVRLLREHEIVEAASGMEGLAQMEEGEPFDAILCDVMMPQLSGLDVYERMQTEHPELTDRLVLMSGGAFDPRIQELLSTFAELPLIDKPFDVAQLRAVLDLKLRGSFPP